MRCMPNSPSRKPMSYQLALRHSAASMLTQAPSVRQVTASRMVFIWRKQPPRPRNSALLLVDAGGAGQIAVDAGDALDLALGGKALVEAFLAELARHLAPWSEAL